MDIFCFVHFLGVPILDLVGEQAQCIHRGAVIMSGRDRAFRNQLQSKSPSVVCARIVKGIETSAIALIFSLRVVSLRVDRGREVLCSRGTSSSVETSCHPRSADFIATG